MKFYDFVEFLETGKVAPVEVVTEQLELTNNSDEGSVSTLHVTNTITPLQYNNSVSRLVGAASSSHTNSDSNTNTNSNEDTESERQQDRQNRQTVDGYSISSGGNNNNVGGVPPVPPSASPECEYEYDPSQTQPIITEAPEDIEPDTNTNTNSNTISPLPGDPAVTGLHIVSYSGGPGPDGNSMVGPRSPVPIKPLWKKREVVRQERTIHYTTVDATGTKQVTYMSYIRYYYSSTTYMYTHYIYAMH